jgi:N-acetylglucosamine-6-phosphate deacetylase
MAIEAGAQASNSRVPGFLGLHLEGPHLSIARKGAHDPALIRPMDDEDEAALIAARDKMPVLLTTVAPESVDPARIAWRVEAGIVVSLGHSDARDREAIACSEAGASMATHLFNAMSQITNREPGLAGAAIDSGMFFAGLIADGFHVDPVTIRIALKAKQAPGRLFLVTDAMASLGTDMTSFTLNGRTIARAGGRLTLDDGTLAGADLDMISAVRFMHRTIGVELSEALRMASLYPARAVGVDDSHGHLSQGARADIVHLSSGLDVCDVWIGGDRVFSA